MKKNNLQLKLIAVFIFFSLAIIAGLRSGNDPDYQNYRNIYDYASISSVDIEPFYLWINQLFKLLGISFEGLILLIALASVMLKCMAVIKYSEYFFLSIVIYISSIYLLFDLIAIRQGFSIALIMLSLRLWENRKLSALLLILIASLFHIASLSFIPVLFLVGRDFSKKFLIICLFFLSSIIVGSQVFSLMDFIQTISFLPGFVSSKIAIYSSYDKEAVSSYKQILVSILAYIVYTKVNCSQYVKSCCLVYIFGSIFTTLFSSIGDIAFRLKWFFLWTEIIFVPYTIQPLLTRINNQEGRILVKGTFFALISILYIYSAYTFVNSVNERGASLIF
ncbi:EpsG family protein [Pectobacterium brasiliense]|uniref:EpsG family protein n=1 Tax=Pectobacterium brasiliense TaxID=180957 RepID=UPI001CE1AC2E|nr:EpsG family protein [Pectobacterium brasiliense]MCA5918293.1 EpsG family protein [Pectobacterium brasiliense]MCA5926168.1 EpsG family protein [Pectobacterium brasiliense]MCA5934157.1 EpsG family protein [Pectobacterium brasiliense]MCA5938339.1 EpsG family protein [Pectobacterium brasiliense]MCA5944610.1 EpsG family protein [Pectobacterium brasiliense]